MESQPTPRPSWWRRTVMWSWLGTAQSVLSSSCCGPGGSMASSYANLPALRRSEPSLLSARCQASWCGGSSSPEEPLEPLQPRHSCMSRVRPRLYSRGVQATWMARECPTALTTALSAVSFSSACIQPPFAASFKPLRESVIESDIAKRPVRFSCRSWSHRSLHYLRFHDTPSVDHVGVPHEPWRKGYPSASLSPAPPQLPSQGFPSLPIPAVPSIPPGAAEELCAPAQGLEELLRLL
mmetsp:Transcript_26785/g.75230  ORF Transcript_26785/g.75230 Transcript_26785/m.75230 type:complete len:238 (-) Transcript_26785:2373-3086(-)